MRPADLVREALLSVTRFPGRSMLTALGTVLGAAAFVSTLGLVSTLGQQVSASFDVRRATEVLVQPQDQGADTGWQSEKSLQRLRELNGVRAAGPRVLLDERPTTRAIGVPVQGVRLMGVDPPALRVIGPALAEGRLFTEYDERNALRIVLLPRSVADQLGVTRTQAAVFIDNEAYTVAGIFDDVTRRPEALTAALVPFRTAGKLTSANPKRDVIIETAPGAAQQIAHQAPLALKPEAAEALRSIAPPDPKTLRREIEDNVTRSSLMVSLVTLVIGTVSIGNAATASIATRTAEIGLRRAVGGRPAHVFAQLLAETTVLGALGGAVGAFLGVCVTSAVSLWNGWTPVIDLRLALVASAVCAAAGLVAGLVPAARATRIQPVAALQR
ncbi:putative ABC transport system permease protein [Lentzea albidocapillata subsp. violacea]|uniref:Putative ABC transport system permease protein n=1 Tax=Lentzea albidocapillata subsp. violacea TaxID=128104 RepID=A0A1G8QCZ7_9PSEU|nr:ABC transporter permease [Lentzea albidocapillata]SDJ02571.1 putative ABC transport system permease protein [Lentzea albidocapillata subsp. violacea]